MSNDSGDRIAKVIARAGLASRRTAEQWIAAGRVAVNGMVIASPALNVTAKDAIAVDGQPLPSRERTRLFRYHKPRGVVTTTSDPDGRPTIFTALPSHLPRLVSIGRLDLNTEGLLLLTNDGGLARVLELPRTAWLRRYRVRAFGRVTQPALDKLSSGVTIAGMRYGPIEAALDREQGANVWLSIGIREGKNREIRNVMEHLGLKVNRLIRVAFGPFELGGLADGTIEEVETGALKAELGDDLISQAEADFTGPALDRSIALATSRRHSETRGAKHRGAKHGGAKHRGANDHSTKRDGPSHAAPAATAPTADDDAPRPKRERPTAKKFRRRDRARAGPRPARPTPRAEPR